MGNSSSGPSAREPHDERRASLNRGARDRSIEIVLHCFAESVGAEGAVLLASDLEREAGTRVVATWARDGREPVISWTSESPAGRVLAGEGTLVESPNGTEARGYATVATAVRLHDRVVGAIYAELEPKSTPSRERLVWSADSYARLAALCLSETDAGVATVLGSASLDALTGCLSYGGAVEVLKAEMQRSQRRGHRLSCCMIDLDDFKRVNDSRGHIEGNRVLAATGAALRAAARRYDAVGRFGGDEFIVVLPETSGRASQRAAQRLLAGVRSATAAVTTAPIEASAGVVEWDGDASPTALLEEADQAMRRAKAAGGARVHVGAPPRGRFDGLAELTGQLVRPFRGEGDGPDDVADRVRRG